MKSKIITILFYGLFCGQALALPQDWPCDVFTLYPAKQTDKYAFDFKGVSGDYEATVYNLDPLRLSIYCGNAGCGGKIENLKTDQEEYVNFYCDYDDDEAFALKCEIILGEEYRFTKFSENEYRAELCGGESYVYFNLNECSNCECTVKDSRPNGSSGREMNCMERNGKIRCLSNNEYTVWREFHAEEYDAKKCVGSSKP